MEFNKKIEDELLKYADQEYLEFSRDLNVGNTDVKQIGVRIPILREISKELSKEYDLEYLIDNINENYYEEIMLKGMLISQYKNLEWHELEKYIKYYIPKIFDWCLCDTFCSSLKISKKYLKQIKELIQNYLKSNKEFEVRFGLVMLLNYYICDEYIEEIFKVINDITLDKYYVKMANAWLISYCAIKYYDRTLSFLKNDCRIDKWTYNKGIQKSIESFRITKERKEELKKLKRLE